MTSCMIIPCYWANHDLVEMTLKCIKSFDQFDKPESWLLVDDGSPIRLEEEHWAVVERNKNGGYAAAVNSGLEVASSALTPFDVYIICNNDMVFMQPDWYSHLLEPLKQGYDISSIRTTDSDGWETEDKITEGDKFGSLWAMKRKVYETIGGLDESFGKGYFEDLDFKKRAEDSGFRIGKNHAGLVEHLGKGTFSRIDPDDGAYHKAMVRFKEKWGKVW